MNSRFSWTSRTDWLTSADYATLTMGNKLKALGQSGFFDTHMKKTGKVHHDGKVSYLHLYHI